MVKLYSNSVIAERAQHQAVRIKNGVQNGSLTKGETVKLVRQQARIAADVYRAVKDDGHLGPRERNSIRKEQNQASRDIFEAKHNGVKR